MKSSSVRGEESAFRFHARMNEVRIAEDFPIICTPYPCSRIMNYLFLAMSSFTHLVLSIFAFHPGVSYRSAVLQSC